MLRKWKLATTAAIALLLATEAQAEPVAIVGATLIDGSGGTPLPDAVVIMDNGRFIAVGSRTDVAVPKSASVIDATGKYLVPGLMNANVHLIDGVALMGVGGTVAAIEYLVRYEDRFPEVIEEGSQIALKNGMTTLFDTWNAFEPAKIARDRIARGEVQGARLYVAGNIVGMSGPFSADFCLECVKTMTPALRERMNDLFEAGVGKELNAMSPEQVRTAIKAYIARDPDFIKVAANSHNLYGGSPYITFSDDVLAILRDEARAAGLTFQTHTVSIEGLRLAIDLKADVMQHCTYLFGFAEPIPDAYIEKMKKDDVWCEVQPVTHRWESSNPSISGGAAGPPPFDHIKQLIEAKAPLLMGTDAGVTDPDMLAGASDAFKLDRPWELGNDHFLWFEAMAEKGMAPMDAILAATSNIAKAYKKPDLGMVASGKIADAVILSRNPLENISNMRSITMVIKDGKVVDRDKLPDPGLVSVRKH